ncbi:MAG: DNA-directed RNA polymerase subunit alpha [Candidatus Tagabacteria bacterium CG09_land_8_20_14_0_10_41_14]|uniref:DNA-directed RNA polymerase subunit alpha n=2 Tax=Candidatus Tagaibacteriota TaxID=1817918 RepID=A0A2H0WL19_9BACT|nr:MAG: DNA-directed RNA polymerase subunit alpha [Candidatus Tagabacteria bacterium CG09_land_8_20_14_0_10_41_14]PJE72966.1 MAG: DNA-directed RNA polymerase subunit alpha [Candidatus Tagabacteria bacterium CG10_big_fil_rev_8_21_14_0_10_40_13]
MDYQISLPTKPKVVLEEENKGVYEIEGLYAGYGYTLGNSLRRIILSSLPGAAITTIKIKGVNHEFSTIPGVKEDVLAILLNLKQTCFKMNSDEPQKLILLSKGKKDITAKDIKTPSQIEILNKDTHIATITDKDTELNIEMTVEKGLGYVPKENLKKEKIETGMIIVDASFTPIRRVNYEVESMRVGERTDYNRLRFVIETDGSITPREAIESSIKTLIRQLSAIVEMTEKETEKIIEETKEEQNQIAKKEEEKKEIKSAAEEVPEKEEREAESESEEEVLKTRIEDLNLSNRILNALSRANIRTVGGLVRKKEEDLLQIDGLGGKGLIEIRRALGNFGLILR